MRYLLILTFLLFLHSACSTGGNEERNEDESTVANEISEAEANPKVEFSCDTLTSSEGYVLSVLLSTYDEAIPVDTLNECAALGNAEARKYQAPDNVESLAEGDGYVYYNAVEKDQLIIMRSPQGQSMNYQVFLSIPLRPAVNEVN